MKTQIHTKPVHNNANPAGQRIGLRPGAAKVFEHRSERRKIREQLRRLDWRLNAEGEVFT